MRIFACGRVNRDPYARYALQIGRVRPLGKDDEKVNFIVVKLIDFYLIEEPRSSRSVEYAEGSLLFVNEQGARKRDEEMRRLCD